MPGIDFPKMEEEVLARWERDGVFRKTLEKPAPRGTFVFYEGPPTANGRPGIHHVEARAFKDIIPRFRTMQGYRVDRKAGWDTHGLPVELEVEKKLGISGKPQIEALKPTVAESIAHFNALCKESVWTYLEDWKRLTARIGFWLDMDRPYVTYEPAYVESLWAAIKTVWDRGLMVEDDKIVPYCPRCGTALSSHEVAQGYKEVSDPSVYVKFRGAGRSFLVWTTTPWTLPANVALAVGPDIAYVEVEAGGERMVLAKSRLMTLEGTDHRIVAEMIGADLVGQTYGPLYTLAHPEGEAFRVIAGDFVSTEDGTGIVHIAPAFGEDDMRVARENGLPTLKTVDAQGAFAFPETDDAFGRQLHGMFVKDGDALITEDLKTRGLLLRVAPYIHEYPFCWRCATPLIYYAKRSWFFAVSKVKDALIANAETIAWTPGYIKEGRFGEWLKGIRDWAISRERYWGTPIPVWTCADCGKQECLGSFAQLRERATAATRPGADFDPHRPFIDAVVLGCACGGAMHRTPDVMDVWFDSGAMPFAQWHYPFAGKEQVDGGAAYPADYIAEAIDQTRGWFYTLLATATLLGRDAPYKNVVCLGHVLDAKGQKMSKSKGNVVDPFAMIDRYGADACRFYMYTVNQPGDPKRFDEADLEKVVKQTMNILWNVLTFWETYKGEADATPGDHVLDRWIRARLAELVRSVTTDLEAYRVTEAGRAVAAFVDDLSTWYVRRSRDRFKGPERAAAAAALREVLRTFSAVLAPFMPFLAESLHARLGDPAESVHLADWPEADAPDQALLDEMAHARRIVSFGLEERANAKVPVRQPLAAADIRAAGVSDEVAALIRDELNVLTLRFAAGDGIQVTLDTAMTPELKLQGALRELIRQVQQLRKQAGLTVHDRITLHLMGADDELLTALEGHAEEILTAVRGDSLSADKPETVSADAQVMLAERAFWVGIRAA